MPRLLNQLRQQSRLQWMLGCAALLAATLLWAIDLRSNLAVIAWLNDHTSAALAQHQSRQLKTQAARDAEEQATRINHTIQSIAPRISPEILTTELYTMARQSGVRRLTIQNALPEVNFSLTDCPVILDFQGSLADSIRFLRQAETGSRPAHLQGVKLTAIPDSSSQFNVQASLDFYGSSVQ